MDGASDERMGRKVCLCVRMHQAKSFAELEEYPNYEKPITEIDHRGPEDELGT